MWSMTLSSHLILPWSTRIASAAVVKALPVEPVAKIVSASTGVVGADARARPSPCASVGLAVSRRWRSATPGAPILLCAAARRAARSLPAARHRQRRRSVMHGNARAIRATRHDGSLDLPFMKSGAQALPARSLRRIRQTPMVSSGRTKTAARRRRARGSRWRSAQRDRSGWQRTCTAEQQAARWPAVRGATAVVPRRASQAWPMRSLIACTALVPLSSSAAKIIAWNSKWKPGMPIRCSRKSDGSGASLMSG